MLCFSWLRLSGGVAELAYAVDLKSTAERIVGSSPTAPTTYMSTFDRMHRAGPPDRRHRAGHAIVPPQIVGYLRNVLNWAHAVVLVPLRFPGTKETRRGRKAPRSRKKRSSRRSSGPLASDRGAPNENRTRVVALKGRCRGTRWPRTPGRWSAVSTPWRCAEIGRASCRERV